MKLQTRSPFGAICRAIASLGPLTFAMLTVAGIINAFGVVLFLSPVNLYDSGLSGTSMLLSQLSDGRIPLALFLLLLNIPLFLYGLKRQGVAFTTCAIYAVTVYSLASLFFARFVGLWRQARYAAAHRKENPAFEAVAQKFARYGVLTLAACVLFFVVVPVVIYVLSYIPYLRAYGEVHWNLRTFQRIWDAQVLMFNYHKNLVATHSFASPGYEWPLIIKPMWYYKADYPAAGMASSILSFGNPAVWWTGLVGILFVLGYSVYRNALPVLGVIPGRNDEYDRALPVIAVGFLSAYLPWVLVSRLTFIYHYFASVPFIILATAQGLRYLERHNRRLAQGLAIALCVAAVLLFIGFYPLASGVEVPRAWCDAMNWFDRWMWY